MYIIIFIFIFQSLLNILLRQQGTLGTYWRPYSILWIGLPDSILPPINILEKHRKVLHIEGRGKQVLNEGRIYYVYTLVALSNLSIKFILSR